MSPLVEIDQFCYAQLGSSWKGFCLQRVQKKKNTKS